MVASAAPGAGKSFEARRQAAESGASYVLVRLNATLSPPELGRFLAQQLGAEEGQLGEANSCLKVVHLDLAETVDADIDRAWASLLFLGCLPGSQLGSEGRLWWWDPSTTAFVVEVTLISYFLSMAASYSGGKERGKSFKKAHFNAVFVLIVDRNVSCKEKK